MHSILLLDIFLFCCMHEIMQVLCFLGTGCKNIKLQSSGTVIFKWKSTSLTNENCCWRVINPTIVDKEGKCGGNEDADGSGSGDDDEQEIKVKLCYTDEMIYHLNGNDVWVCSTQTNSSVLIRSEIKLSSVFNYIEVSSCSNSTNQTHTDLLCNSNTSKLTNTTTAISSSTTIIPTASTYMHASDIDRTSSMTTISELTVSNSLIVSNQKMPMMTTGSELTYYNSLLVRSDVISITTSEPNSSPEAVIGISGTISVSSSDSIPYASPSVNFHMGCNGFDSKNQTAADTYAMSCFNGTANGQKKKCP